MYPISYEADFDPEPNRWTTFFRIIVAIPWLIVALFWTILFAFTHFAAWIAIIILGRYPQWLFDFNSGVVRFWVRVGAWLYLQTDVWPPFGLDDDPSYPIRVNIAPAAARQSRLKAFFRLILLFPLEVVIYFGIGALHSGAAAVAWLTIVFRGYVPEGVFNTLTFVNGFYARVAGYLALLTDSYPPVGVERAKPVVATPPTGVEPTAPPPAAA